MTALVFALQPEQVCLAMDTLVVGADDRLPLSFQHKFHSLPDSELVVAGTGLANFINGWFAHLSALACVGDIDDLNNIAPGVLKASADAAGGLGAITTTIYHFGYSRSDCQYVGYAYRSINEFQSERLPYGLGFKPHVPVTPTDDINFPEFLVDIVVKQQSADRSLPVQQQLGIGGEIEFAVLSGRTTRIETVHRFLSYDREKQHIDSRGEA
jgi:hypothetical protein